MLVTDYLPLTACLLVFYFLLKLLKQATLLRNEIHCLLCFSVVWETDMLFLVKLRCWVKQQTPVCQHGLFLSIIEVLWKLVGKQVASYCLVYCSIVLYSILYTVDHLSSPIFVCGRTHHNKSIQCLKTIFFLTGTPNQWVFWLTGRSQLRLYHQVCKNLQMQASLRKL